MAQDHKPASTVVYVGAAHSRKIGASDWKKVGAEDQKAVTWGGENGKTVAAGELSADALKYLATDPGFKVVTE